MGSETNPPPPSASSSAPTSTSTSTSASPSGKRSRDPEDEVYVDNLHSHKRYLSEIMASSLNGLTVGDDPLPENLMYSPARSESMFYPRDDMSLQYSPMSEDLDDCRYYENHMNMSDSLPTSPVSPYRYQRHPSVFSCGPPTTSFPLHAPTVSPSAPRQRGSDSEGRFPSSPSDICHSADLRRAALMRSVQMRTQPPPPSPYELPFAGQEPSYMKSLVDEKEYQIEDVCNSLSMLGPENREKSCRVLSLKLKGDDDSVN